jgi:FKBP-type peptidyl-prolyl cis-trans isomerase FkpA
MKKFFIAMGVVALSLATIGCGSEQKTQSKETTPAAVRNINLKKYTVAEDAELDTLSYTVGANLGLQMRFGIADFNLNHDLYLKYMIEFFENGDRKDPALLEGQQKLTQFHYTQYMPYMRAKQVRETFATDRPDTLPVPELYNEEFTKETITSLLGRNSAAMLLDMKEDIDLNWVITAFRDGTKVNSEETISDELRISEEQMNIAFMNYHAKRQQREFEEYQKALVENAEASAAWLAEVAEMEGVQKTESGLLYRIDREGSDVHATEDTDIVEVNYEGKTRDGNIFDSSYERGESISFPLNRVIKGWTEGMKLIGEGGQITLWIPADMAYGERGAGEDIGPNEALQFKVELIKVNPEE